MTDVRWPADRHPGEELSALLDGELSPADALSVRRHLAACQACAEEFEDLRGVRTALRTLPGLEPPPALTLGLPTEARADEGGRRELHLASAGPRRRGDRTLRAPVPAIAAVAAGIALFLVVVTPPADRRYEPQVEAAVGSHMASLAALSGQQVASIDVGPDRLQPARPVVPTTAPRRDLQDLPAPYRAPERLGDGYELVDGFSHPGGLQLVYRRGRYGLSVFEAPGRLDPADLPTGGRRVSVAGVQGWQWGVDGEAGGVVVFERHGLVMTVVGDEPGDGVLEAARSIPEPRPLSVPQRLGQVAEDVLSALSP